MNVDCDVDFAPVQKVSRMKSKNNIEKTVYKALDWLERERSEYITNFWRCVFKEVIRQQYPTLERLYNRLLDGQSCFDGSCSVNELFACDSCALYMLSKACRVSIHTIYFFVLLWEDALTIQPAWRWFNLEQLTYWNTCFMNENWHNSNYFENKTKTEWVMVIILI